MNANAPLASLLHVGVEQQRADCVALTAGAELGDIKVSSTIFLNNEEAIDCVNRLKQAGRILERGQTGSITGEPFPRMGIDIDFNRGGVVLALPFNSDLNYYFLRGAAMINALADALLNVALTLQMQQQGTEMTRH